MIAHQRLIREWHAGDGHPVPADFSTASVREISTAKAKTIIAKYEWLAAMGGSAMGATRRAFGLFFDGELAGVECFGANAGSNTAASVCGPEHAHEVLTLVRGACIHWAHPHSASFLISASCRMLAREGKHIFVAYSDEDGGEIGTVYQASNWFYCGVTNPQQGRLFQAPGGKWRDERCISGFARQRANDGPFFFRKPTRKEVTERMDRLGFKFSQRSPKHRYVGIYGDKSVRRELRAALVWQTLPYPKRREAGVPY